MSAKRTKQVEKMIAIQERIVAECDANPFRDELADTLESLRDSALTIIRKYRAMLAIHAMPA